MPNNIAESVSMHFMETLVLIHRNFYRHLSVPVPFNQFAVLMTLLVDGPGSPSEISQLLHMSKQQMASISERLAAAGLIAKHADSRDHRRVLLSLTPEGAKLIEDQNEIVRQRFIHSLKHLQPEEQQSLEHAIQLLNNSIEKMANN